MGRRIKATKRRERVTKNNLKWPKVPLRITGELFWKGSSETKIKKNFECRKYSNKFLLKGHNWVDF